MRRIRTEKEGGQNGRLIEGVVGRMSKDIAKSSLSKGPNVGIQLEKNSSSFWSRNE